MSANTLKAKVCLVGESAVGKSSLVRRFVLDQFEDRYTQTLGTKVMKKTVAIGVDGEPYRVVLTIWDIMGELDFMNLLKDAYFFGARGVLAVCDVTRADTLTNLDKWVARVRGMDGHMPLILLANKWDLQDQLAIQADDVGRAAGALDCPHVLTSAKTGENVERAFETIAVAVARRTVQAASGKAVAVPTG